MITMYAKDSTEYKNIEKAVEMLNTKAKENNTDDIFRVIDCYWDFGANMMWNTIEHNYATFDGKRSEYQMLYPRQHEQIINGNFDIIDELWDNRLGGKR